MQSLDLVPNALGFFPYKSLYLRNEQNPALLHPQTQVEEHSGGMPRGHLSLLPPSPTAGPHYHDLIVAVGPWPDVLPVTALPS